MIYAPLDHLMILSVVLFIIGLTGLLIRRNIIMIFLCIEIMFNASGMAFIMGGAKWCQPDGQIMFLFIITVAAAEIAVGLALTLVYYHHFRSLNTRDAINLSG
jgi:NADH-quinone oxidoreductase subunit K